MMDIVMKCHELSSFNLVINQFIKGIYIYIYIL